MAVIPMYISAEQLSSLTSSPSPPHIALTPARESFPVELKRFKIEFISYHSQISVPLLSARRNNNEHITAIFATRLMKLHGKILGKEA